MCRLSWFLDPGGWSKTATVRLYFIFPGICTLSLHLPQYLAPGFFIKRPFRIHATERLKTSG
ncbi:hypothetical protein STEG23_023405, partial [Scotinomys teguina]